MIVMRHHAIQQEKFGPVAGTNQCGVPAYWNRTEAERASARGPRGRDRRRPQKCDDCGLFHLRRLPEMVIRGIVTVDEWYGRNGKPCYREILAACSDLATRAGALFVEFSRGPGDYWNVRSEAYGQEIDIEAYPDPVEATEALLEEINTAFAERQAELEEVRAA